MSSSTVLVSRLGSDDWRTLRDLRLRAVAESPDAFLVREDRERPHIEEDWHAYLRSGIWLVARKMTDHTGMLCLVVDPDTGRRYVESMWVAPNHRHSGVGSQLLSCAFHIVRSEQHVKLFLWVLEGNGRAREFFHGKGFRPTGRRQPLGPPPSPIEEEFQLTLRS
jgi:GNAT superfamily N-acetyltransferase